MNHPPTRPKEMLKMPEAVLLRKFTAGKAHDEIYRPLLTKFQRNFSRAVKLRDTLTKFDDTVLPAGCTRLRARPVLSAIAQAQSPVINFKQLAITLLPRPDFRLK
jgi:hypothetical protein